MKKELTLENISDELENWLARYFKYLPFEALQKLIPIRDFLFEHDPDYIRLLAIERKYEQKEK